MTDEKYKSGFAGLIPQTGEAQYVTSGNNIVYAQDIDKMDSMDIKEYREVVKNCRFFYRKDPIAGTVIDKMIDLGITDIYIEKNGLSENEFRIFTGIKPMLKRLAATCGLEWLLSGLVIPQISYGAATRDVLKEMGVKKYETMTIPQDFWLVPSESVKINSVLLTSTPSYFIEIPAELIHFVQTKGTFPDGTKDEVAYTELAEMFPEFVTAILAGKLEIQIKNPLIVRRRPLSDCPYPTPYLYRSLESMKEKRNLKRMDYSLASRVTTAIEHVRVGNDEFPAVEQDQDRITHLQNQLLHRNSGRVDTDRIFQLVTDHTVEIEWVLPDVQALLSDSKYIPVNSDIFFGLGFPRILTTGETDKSATSDPEFATMSPMKTMEAMQEDILPIIKGVLKEVSNYNGFKSIPTAKFDSINLHSFATFIEGMTALYNTGNLSRTDYTAALSYDWLNQMTQKSDEKKVMTDLGIEEFPQVPFSPQPNNDKTKQNMSKPKESQ
jgi:hypothetical protein